MAHSAFYRPVRSYPDPLPEEIIKIDAPPAQPNKQGGTSVWLQLLYPLSGLLLSGIFIFSTTMTAHGAVSPLLLIAEISILPLSVGIMLLANLLQRRSARQQIKAEHERYRKYLDGKERRVSEIASIQREHNARLYPNLPTLAQVITQRQMLWERRPLDADFLTVRIGLAPMPLCCPIEFQADYRVIYDSDLLQAVNTLTTQKRYLDQQPLTIALPQYGTIAIAGQPNATRALMRAILCQIMAFHAPNEVRIAAYFPASAASDWAWLKWLPHTRRLRQHQPGASDEQLCMLADSVADFQQMLLTQIKPEVERRSTSGQDARSGSPHIPHFIVLLDGFRPDSALAQMAGLEEMLRNASRLGMTILCLVEHEQLAPSMLQARLSLTTTAQSTQLTYIETRAGGAHVEFVMPDRADKNTCERLARALTPLNIIDMDAALDFSQEIRLLDLFAIPELEQFCIAEYWRSRSPQELLCVPIGQQKNGPLLLDLKEMAMGGAGPHGLLVGATGSGKSELLRTIVTSLALTHDPQTVNFVLVDFKAGAAFADFTRLPHVAGIITNLENDPLLISRMYASLLGEQNRRQMLLSRAGNLGNIRQYQELWRRNPTLEPMPYLIIIVDEFAQLIAEHEEFLALFTKFGQVGRSLGMHMLLATQRIDEGRIKTLDGHLRYRICLRTFKPEESSAVIGTPDAYYLPPSPGSGYFKVDDDIYTAFKTALISTPYITPTQQQVDPTTLIREFTVTGKLIATTLTARADQQQAQDNEQQTEMHMVVEQIRHTMPPQGGWHVHPVWQPPLQEKLPLDEVLERTGYHDLDGTHWYPTAPFGILNIPIGLLDRPANQLQEPILLDFSGFGGHLAIVGAPQSGKSTLLRTIISAFLVTHMPDIAQFYCIDFGGGLLRVFEDAPHVGVICGKTERDKIRRVVRRVRQVLIEREALFSKHGIDSMATYRRLRQEKRLPQEDFGDVFLLLDNFGQFQADFESSDADIISDIATLIANGLTYGIHIILTANQWIEIRPRLRSNIGTRLELRLNDPSESEIERKLAMTIPPHIPGRGLHQAKLLFQTALPMIRMHGTTAKPAEMNVQNALEDLVRRVRVSWHGTQAPRIPVLPLEVRWAEMPPLTIGQTGIPIGLDEFKLQPFTIDLLQHDPHFLILGDRECGKTTLLRTWLRGIERSYTPEQVQYIVIDYKKTLLDMSRSTHLLSYAFTPEKVKECVKFLKNELEHRIEQHQALPIEQLQAPQAWSGLHYIIFVDDYEQVTTPDPRSGNPLNPLEGLLQSAHEIGFHIVLARRIVNFGQTTLDPIFRGIKNMESPGLLMRGDPVEGRLVLHKQSISDTLPTGRGSLVRRGYPPTLVQVAI